MVNPIKTFVSRAFGIGGGETTTAASTSTTDTSSTAPVVTAQAAPTKASTGRAQTYGPAVIGTGLTSGGSVGDSRGKTLLGQ